MMDILPNFQRDVLAGRSPAIQLNVDATRMTQASRAVVTFGKSRQAMGLVVLLATAVGLTVVGNGDGKAASSAPERFAFRPDANVAQAFGGPLKTSFCGS
jgi:hypothetical protein